MLAGIDEGLPYEVDPLPLTMLGELTARLQGRTTFAYYLGYVTYRDAGRIMRPARIRTTVLAAHKCGHSLMSLIEPTRAAQMTRVLTMLRKSSDPKEDDTGQRALVSIADLLNGRVVDDRRCEPAPF